jgi:hypothetical protein
MKKQFTYIAAAFLFAGMLSAQKIDLNAMPKPGLPLHQHCPTKNFSAQQRTYGNGG